MDNEHNRLRDMVRQYKMPDGAVRLLSNNPPLTISGITAAGKETIASRIAETTNWKQVISHTTRHLRPGEQNGREYIFIDDAAMLKLLQGQAFIEAKLIHGTFVSAHSIASYQKVLDDSMKPLLNIDTQGAETILDYLPDLRPFFILPPSFEEWIARLDKRGHMSHVERIKRMQTAKTELETAIANERFVLVVNDEIPRVTEEILNGVTDTPSQYHKRELARRLIDHIRAY